MIARLILPYARAYAALYGEPIPDSELRREIERRAAGIPLWGALAAALGAWAIRWWAPLIILGAFRRFENLSPEEADKVLQGLQFSRRRAVKGLFMTLKVLVLPLCYGNERHLSRIGYKMTKEAAGGAGCCASASTPPSKRGAVRADVVVVGSGAGGACVAGRLARGGARVLLLEKGGRAETQADAVEAVSRYYVDAGFTAGLGSVLLPIATGSTVGGTTTINSGTCLKTPEALLRAWESRSGGRFRAAEFSDRLDEAWTALKVRRAPAETMSRSSRLVLEGLARLGVKTGERLDRAEDGCEGLGRCCFVCPNGSKMTSDRAFLVPKEGEILEVRTGRELVSVTPPRRAGEPVRIAVRTESSRSLETIECEKLVLSMGSLATPYFVRTFRLGPHASRAGDDLSIHPASKIFARFSDPVRGWEGVPQGVGLVDPEDESIRYEGVYTPPEMAALTMPMEGARLRGWMESYDRVATFGYMIKDEARGSIRYPAGPSRPLIRYEMSPQDVRRMGRGMRFAAGIFFAAGARRVVLPLHRPDGELGGKEDLEAFDFASVRPGQLNMMAFHPLGTCGMGRVVDEDLRACPGVYICDGSVVPESLGVNPQITIYAFALRLASHLLNGRAA